MKSEHLYLSLLDEIKKNIPRKSKLVHTLADILCIEKEAVYRRLRGEVPFTFQEIAVVAKKMRISLDEMIGIDAKESKLFRLKLPDFAYPEKTDYFIHEESIRFLKRITAAEKSEIGILSNVLPQELFSGFDHLIKFNVFKWLYFYNNNQMKPYEELAVPDKIMSAFKILFSETKKIKVSNYIFDNRIFFRLQNEIEYFKSIRLLTGEDIFNIKNDLLAALDYLEQTTLTGKLDETGNKISVYITDVETSSSYCYMKADEIEYALINTFILTSVTSLNKKMYRKVKDWIHATMKISNLITKSSEQQRVSFFEQQREIIGKL